MSKFLKMIFLGTKIFINNKKNICIKKAKNAKNEILKITFWNKEQKFKNLDRDMQ